MRELLSLKYTSCFFLILMSHLILTSTKSLSIFTLSRFQLLVSVWSIDAGGIQIFLVPISKVSHAISTSIRLTLTLLSKLQRPGYCDKDAIKTIYKNLYLQLSITCVYIYIDKYCVYIYTHIYIVYVTKHKNLHLYISLYKSLDQNCQA